MLEIQRLLNFKIWWDRFALHPIIQMWSLLAPKKSRLRHPKRQTRGFKRIVHKPMATSTSFIQSMILRQVLPSQTIDLLRNFALSASPAALTAELRHFCNTRTHTRTHTHTHLLAEDDSILQSFLEVLSNRHSRYFFNPEAELLLLLWVIFLSNLKDKTSCSVCIPFWKKIYKYQQALRSSCPRPLCQWAALHGNEKQVNIKFFNTEKSFKVTQIKSCLFVLLFHSLSETQLV